MSLNLQRPALLIVLGTALGLAGCGKHADGKADDDDAPKTSAKVAAPAASGAASAAADTDKAITLSAEELKVAGIEVATMTASAQRVPVALTGNVIANPDRYAKVLPVLPGRIVSVTAALGSMVKAGQTLAVIESIELGEAQSAHAQARSEAQVADAAVARAEKLAAEDIVPRKDLLRARADAERARATLQTAAGRLRMLGVAPAVAGDANLAPNPALYALVSPG